MNDIEKVSIATEEMIALVEELREVKAMKKAMKKAFEAREEKLKAKLEWHMGDAETLATEDGEELLRWKYSVAPVRFDAKRFKEELPNIYKHYVGSGEPIRRMIINVK